MDFESKLGDASQGSWVATQNSFSILHENSWSLVLWVLKPYVWEHESHKIINDIRHAVKILMDCTKQDP